MDSCNAHIERGRWCHFCTLPFGHEGRHSNKEIKWADGDKSATPADLERMTEAFRVYYAGQQKDAEIARLTAYAEELRAVLQDMADAGCRHDLNPTMLFGEGEMALSGRYTSYIHSMDSYIRKRAKQALAAEGEGR